MSEKYTGRDRRYAGVDVDITYSIKRCIHAEHCVNQLAQVFDKNKRPWISPNDAPADAVAAVIHECPSGALHYERKDGGAAEQTPDTNTLLLWDNGPLQFTGNLKVSGSTVALDAETRITLCRCGASHNKPFCDNTHKDIGFSTQTVEPVHNLDAEPSGGLLKIIAQPDGPLEVVGSLQIRDKAGNLFYNGTKISLCRCGSSSKKPFCDGTHKTNGFKAD